jgi:hypothetical protein
MLSTKKRPKIFTIGDVVKYDESRITPEEIIRCNVKPDDKGIITGICECADGYSYYIQWFQQLIDTFCTDHYRFTLCEGMKNSDICNKCRFSYNYT